MTADRDETADRAEPDPQPPPGPGPAEPATSPGPATGPGAGSAEPDTGSSRETATASALTTGSEPAPGAGSAGAPGPAGRRPRQQRKQVLLRLDPAVHDALAAWAAAELRSTNAQIEFLLRRALSDAGRLPRTIRPIPKRGRPAKSGPEDGDAARTPDTESG